MAKTKKVTKDTGKNTGNEDKVGYKSPPKRTRFGQPQGNKQNLSGRPKSFDALRRLAQQIAAEELVGVDGAVITRIEALLRVMTSSRNPADRRTFLEYSYGKPKENLDITSGGKALTWKDFVSNEKTENIIPKASSE